MMSVGCRLFKSKNGFIKALVPKSIQEKESAWVCGYVRQFCPSGHCLASLGCQTVTLGTELSICTSHSYSTDNEGMVDMDENNNLANDEPLVANMERMKR